MVSPGTSGIETDEVAAFESTSVQFGNAIEQDSVCPPAGKRYTENIQ